MRSIGRAAGVDPRLVTHYFGSKAALFREAMAFPPAARARVAEAYAAVRGDPGSGRTAAELVVSLVEDPEVRRVMVGIIRAASSEPEAADQIREMLTESQLGPFAAALGGESGGLRASFVASQIVGLVMTRHVVRIGPIAAASPEQLVEAIAPVFDHYLGGDWVLEES
jgi:AcrR family transcriptional regulator